MNLKTTDVKAQVILGVYNNEKTEKNAMHLTNVKAVPKSCVDCSLCNHREEMYMEIPEFGDFKDDSFVARIGCTCKKSLQGYRDFNRTSFTDFENLVDEWNKLQEVEVTKDSECSF